MGFKVVVFRQYAGTNQFLRENLHEIQQVFWIAVADVIDCIGRNGQTILAIFLFRCLLHDANDTLHNIVNVGKVPLAVAKVENLNGLPLQQLVGEAKIGHVWTARRTIDREEAQTRGRNVVELTVGVGHELVALFGGRIERNRIVHLVLDAVGHLLVGAVDRGAGGIHQVLHRIVAAAFQNVVEANQVTLDVGVRVSDGVADTRLSRQVHHNLGLVFLEYSVHCLAVCNVPLYKCPAGFRMPGRRFFNLLQAPFFDGNIVVIVHIIDAHNGYGGSNVQQLQHQIGSNEARRAGDKNRLIL